MHNSLQYLFRNDIRAKKMYIRARRWLLSTTFTFAIFFMCSYINYKIISKAVIYLFFFSPSYVFKLVRSGLVDVANEYPLMQTRNSNIKFLRYEL